MNDWNKIKNNNSISEVQSYMEKYPDSKMYQNAKNKLHELRAVALYEQEDYIGAYYQFRSIDNIFLVNKDNRDKYNQCVEYVDYIRIKSTNDEDQIISFINKYPGGKFSIIASNQLALSRAKKLNAYSTEYDYACAEELASDRETLKTVRAYVANSREAHKSYMKEQRVKRIKENGGYVSFGFKILDFAGDITSSDKYNMNIYTISTGISFKVGNFKAPVQFEIGVKPGVLLAHYKDEDIDNETKFCMPVFSKLKANLFSYYFYPYQESIESKFYIAGIGMYNLVRAKDYDTKFSIGGGIGVAFKHLDWFIIYYKKSIKDTGENSIDSHYGKMDNNFIGSSFSYYF